MNVIFHGVRGSISVSGIEFSRYGGNTTCTEIMTDKAQIILDAGSGFQNVALANDRPIVILLSHFHHDHIQGLGFNPSLFSKQPEIFICSALCPQDTTQSYLKRYYGGTYFPIDLLSEISKLKIVSFNEIKSIFARDLTIESYELNHPGGSVAYSIATSTAKLCCLLDNEYGDNQLQSLSAFVDEANLTIWDGMFNADELKQCRGWGHSSIEQGESFLERSNCKRLAIMHHAPHRTDTQLDAMQQNFKDPAIFIAREKQAETFD
jgi:phosphoribosyl 1,2-cyclic phosphodiesterase